jgi:hypothetical protein
MTSGDSELQRGRLSKETVKAGCKFNRFEEALDYGKGD